MLAVDTNVIVRYLTNDHPRQSAQARELIEQNQVWVPRTVVLESDWVLRSAYRFAPMVIAKALRHFAGLPTVSLEDPPLIARALDWFEYGLDFADALHLGAADQYDAFITFDLALIRGARHVGVAVRQP